jgi:hypothetical protein
MAVLISKKMRFKQSWDDDPLKSNSILLPKVHSQINPDLVFLRNRSRQRSHGTACFSITKQMHMQKQDSCRHTAACSKKVSSAVIAYELKARLNNCGLNGVIDYFADN